MQNGYRSIVGGDSVRSRAGGSGGLGTNGTTAIQTEAGTATRGGGAPGLGHELHLARSAQRQPGSEAAGPGNSSWVSITTPGRIFPSWPSSGRWRPTAELDHHPAQGRQVSRALGEFTSRDVRHAVFLITQPESHSERLQRLAYPDGCDEDGHHRGCGQEDGQGVEIVNDYQVVFRSNRRRPSSWKMLSANT